MIMKEVEKIANALDMDKEDFSQRAMRTTVLSTSYIGTKDALEKTKVNYRRALNLKLGIAVAEVFESFGGVLPLDDFLEKTTTAYMRITGIPILERQDRRSEVKGLVTLKLQRSIELGQIYIYTEENQKFVKIFPEVSSTTFAMLMNPESMLRSPYVKAMAQTIGSMALVDANPRKMSRRDLASTVQDNLNSHHLLEVIKPVNIFSVMNIEPFHQHNKVPFYSEYDDKLFILPTFPATGNPSSLASVPALVSKELAYELVEYGTLEDLVSGLNPSLITMRHGDNIFYFNRQAKYIEDLEKLLGTKLSKYLPKNESALATLGELQSKLGKDFGDGTKVSQLIDLILKNGVKDVDLDEFGKRMMGPLWMRVGLVSRSQDGIYQPTDSRTRTILNRVAGLCDVVNPVGHVVSRMVTREVE